MAKIITLKDPSAPTGDDGKRYPQTKAEAVFVSDTQTLDNKMGDFQVKSDISQDITTDKTSTTKYPSAKAVYDLVKALDDRVKAIEDDNIPRYG